MVARRLVSLWQYVAAVVVGALPVWLLGCGDVGQQQVREQRATASPESPAAIAQSHKERAQRLLADHNYAQAVVELTAALNALRTPTASFRQDTHDVDVLLERGSAYLKMGFPDTAAADFAEALRIRPNDGTAFGLRGQCHLLTGDLYKAVRDCTEAIRWQPGNAIAYRTRGDAYMRREQYERAVADLEQAAALEPVLARDVRPLVAEAYARWGEQLAAAGDEAGAELRLAAAQAISPTIVAEKPLDRSEGVKKHTAAKPENANAQAHFAAGELHRLSRQYDQAIAEYTAAIALQSDFADAYLRRGEILLSTNFPDTAVKDFEQAIHFSGESAVAYRLQAQALMALGNAHRAALAATEALHADPSDAQAYAIRGAAYVELRDWRRGIVDLEEAVRRGSPLAGHVEQTLRRAYQLRDAAQVRRETQAEAGSL